jgi:hypothetical protein
MADLAEQSTWLVPSAEHRYCTRCGYIKDWHVLGAFCPEPRRAALRKVVDVDEEDRRKHEDALADTGDAYTIEQRDWEVRCLWCDFTATGITRTACMEKIREHYRTTLGREVEIRG